MKPSLKVPAIIAGAVVIIGSCVGAVYAINGSRKPSLSYSPVKRGDLVRSVSLTGSVRPTEAVDLAFERGGKVVRIPVSVGDKVTSGEVLAMLDASDLKAQTDQAQAAVDGANARLADLQRGLTPEETGVEDAKVAAAQTSLAQAESAASDRLANAYAVADDSIRGKTDPMFIDPTGTTPRLSFFVADSGLVTQIGLDRVQTGNLLHDWSAEQAGASSSDLHAAVASAKSRLSSINGFLTEATLAVDKIDPAANPGLPALTVTGYETSLSMARANVAGAVSALSAADQQLTGAESALALAQSARTLRVSGASSESVAAQQAVVRQAQAALEAVNVQMSKTVIRSPIDGIVTRQDGHVGQLAAPNAAFLSVISDQAFEVKADASEADVADIRVGDAASVTLDAYGAGTTFAATVSQVDPASADADGVPSYRVTLRFSAIDDRIKSGMTANATIVSGARKDVLIVPKEAVIRRGETSYVLVEGSSGPEERQVTTGLRGQDGGIEIVSGLQEGDMVAGFGGRN